jgi:hypothetical protein
MGGLEDARKMDGGIPLFGTTRMDFSLLMVNFRQPSHEFTFNVGIDLLF